MTDQENPPPLPEETDSDRLGGLLADDALSLDLVSAFAGDRQLTKAEECFLEDMKRRRGDRSYGDLLYAINHQYFQPDVAHSVWNDILRHKYEMSAAMNRNVRIVVATLDYLCTLAGAQRSTTLIGEEHMAEIVRTSLRDGLTGLFSHTHCNEAIDTELKRYSGYGSIVSIMMIDIDDFKDVNDRYDHQEGDKVLAILGAFLDRETRDCDICCRG